MDITLLCQRGGENGASVSKGMHTALLPALAASRYVGVCTIHCAAQVIHPPCRRADKAPGQLQLRRKPASRPSLTSLQGAFDALDLAGDGGRGGVS